MSREIQQENNVVASLFREFRIESKLKQSDLASKLGVHQSFISKIETGERRLEVVELYKACHAMGISLTAFAKKVEEKLEAQP